MTNLTVNFNELIESVNYVPVVIGGLGLIGIWALGCIIAIVVIATDR